MSQRAYDPLKRVIDVVVGGVALILSLPVQAVIALLVRVKLGRPVLFRQQRPGKDERVFGLVKFRTMVDVDEQAGLISDEDRLPAFGRLLRATSLDELPSLVNVVRGDMSLVGPRPLLVRYLDRYDDLQRRRHEVRPGMTGLAQINGRNTLTWAQKFAFDVQYVDERSLALDVRIMVLTVVKVIRRQGVAQDGHVTMAEFRGQQP